MATKDQSLLVVDSGLFTHIAEALAPHFGRTMYYAEWVRSPFPQEKHARIGDLPGIERVRDVYAAIDDADLVVFPDVVTANLASYVKKLGKPYFGTTKHAAELELDRWGLRTVLRSVGLPIPEATLVVGTEDLKKVLKSEKNVYVKYGRFRGDLETFHHERWFTTEQWFNDTVRHLGPSAHEAEFIVEEPIEGVEVGVDAWFEDGTWPDTLLWGYELKDAGYVGRVATVESKIDIPIPLWEVCERLEGVLGERDHHGWISTECRITEDGMPYLIDPAMRCGSPPSEAQSLAVENLASIVAGGNIDPQYRGEFVAQLILKSDFYDEHFLGVEIPDKYRENIKLHNHCVIDGRDYCVPVGISEFGAACGYGDTLDAACKMALAAAKEVKAYRLAYAADAFDDLEKIIEKGKKHGVEWE